MYSNKFAACVKVGGKVLREDNGVTTLPFNAEYQVRLKNMASVRAMVKVEIDGTDVTDGTWLVLGPNSSMDLERFIKNGNWNSGNKLKFVKRTGKVEEHRGIKAEDGLVRIEYKFEKQPDPEVHTHHYHHNHYGWDYYWPYYPHYPYWGGTYSLNSNTLNDGHTGSVLRSKGGVRGQSLGGVQANAFNVSKCADSLGDSVANVHTTGALNGGSEVSCFNMSMSSDSVGSAGTEFREASLDPGITVEGSRSDQRFFEAGWFPTEEQSHVIVLKLMGTRGGKAVQRAVTVKTKTKCQTCGTSNKSGVKFCKECGTSLEII